MFCCTGGNQRDKAREKAGKKGPAKKASDSSANAGTSLTDRKQRFVLPLTNIVNKNCSLLCIKANERCWSNFANLM